MVTSARYVEAPVAQPLPFGLLAAALVIEDADAHLGTGVEYESVGCGPAAALSVAACTDGSDDALTADDGWGMVASDAFTVYALHTCRLVGEVTRADTTVREKLALGEGRAIEAQFAARFADADDITPTTGEAMDPRVAVAYLERFAGLNYAGVPTFHMTRDAASLVGGLTPNGGRLETTLGSRVAAGAGYAGVDGPAATGDGESWMFATGPVVVRRGPVVTTDPVYGLAAPTNELGILATRQVVITTECLLAGVLVAAPSAVTP